MPEPLADPRIQQFFATRTVVVLATVLPDGGPLATPVWFLHRAGGLVMISEEATQKVRNLRRDPRVSVAADSESGGGIRGVVVQGRVEFLSESNERRTLAAAFLKKYHPGLRRRWGGDEMPPDRVMFRVVPARVFSWGLSV